MLVLNLAILLTGGSLVALASLVLWRMVRNRFLLMWLKKYSRGLPEMPMRDALFSDNTKLMYTKNSGELFKKKHERDGKTLIGIIGGNFYASTTDLDLIKTFIFDEPDDHLFRAEVALPAAGANESIILNGVEEWKHVRKQIEPAFKSHKFKTPILVGEIEQSVDKIVEYIDRKLDEQGGEKDVSANEIMYKFQLGLLLRCFYKQDTDLADPASAVNHWSRVLNESYRQLQFNPFSLAIQRFPIFLPLINWLNWHFTQMGQFEQKLTDFVTLQAKRGLEAKRRTAELAEEAKRTGAKVDPEQVSMKDGTVYRRNIIDHVIDKFLEGKLTRRQYVANSLIIFAAGFKSIADSMVYTLFMLSNHQDVQDKLRKSVLSEGVDSEYLEWAIKESLRLHSTVPAGCTRTITRDMELEGGHRLPAGTTVHTNTYTINRLKEYWGEDANEFRPERWRDASKFHPCQYLSFGLGPRNCLGKAFALFEMKMLLVALCSRYKFGSREPRGDEYNYYSPTQIVTIPESATYITIRKLKRSEC